MSERIRFSLWFATQTPALMLERLAAGVEALPSEAVARGVVGVSTTALDWSEPALADARFEPGIAVDDALEQVRAFLKDDSVCELELTWLLWIYDQKQWQQKPCPVRLISIGPRFGETAGREAVGENGHLLIEFGLDEPFLAEDAPWNTDTRRHLQANILQLLAYTRKLEMKLQPSQRRLWSEDVGDWTQKLIRRLQMAEAEGSSLVQ